jgi:hypothetical protein
MAFNHSNKHNFAFGDKHTMKSTVIRGVAATILLALVSWPAAAQLGGPEGHVTVIPDPDPVTRAAPTKVHPFALMAGSWSGGGQIDLTNDIKERLRCRANYTYGQANASLALQIRCASDNYKVELVANVTESNGSISGTWQETGYGVSGTISGRAAGGRVTAQARGDSFNAALTVSTSGNRMSVTITPERTYVINVAIALSKAAPATAAR